MPTVETRSRLRASPAAIWAVVSTMEGVNAELGPYVRMSVPAEARGRTLADVPLGEVAFPSWLLAFGFLPFDRHALQLEELDPGHRFLERSTSWLQAVWEHERTLIPLDPTGTEVVDRVHFEPRLALAEPLVRRIVAALFRHRHAHLRRTFGELE